MAWLMSPMLHLSADKIARGTVGWPLAAQAQQGERMRRIGVLFGASADDPSNQAFYAALLQGLQQLGWTDGRNVHIDPRFAAGNAADMRKYAAELVALAPDVIVVVGPTVGSLLQETRTVPIVFTIVPDPVGSGVVDRLSRPGGNATGFMMFEYSLCGKWLELLKEIAPGVMQVAVLRDPAIPAGIDGSKEFVWASFYAQLRHPNDRWQTLNKAYFSWTVIWKSLVISM
jgi:putative ABC transport system substrate-binding protein